MRKIFPYRIQSDMKKWADLLHRQNIRTEKNVDATYGLFEGDTLVATASYYKNIIKCVAISSDFHGGATFNELLTGILNEIYNKGYEKIYVYTKPDTTNGFSAIGFKVIEEVEGELVFMEKATKGFSAYLEELKEDFVEGGRIGAIVLNANPFTLGHQYLVEEASKQADVLHLFVVSEEASAFPQEIRKKLVAEGTKHLPNIRIHDTDSYIVSSATFPAYFLKEESNVAEVQATLDARIFKYHIAEALGITDRFVGQEPFSPTTELYNQAMNKVFDAEPNPGIPRLHIIERKQADNRAISATEVRKLLSEGKIEEASKLVPPTTATFFTSSDFDLVKDRLDKYVKTT